MDSGVCCGCKNLYPKNNSLEKRPKIGPGNETARIQGKIRSPQNLPTELSTETVDSFGLELTAARLQRRRQNQKINNV
jgi:hypothetical protein